MPYLTNFVEGLSFASRETLYLRERPLNAEIRQSNAIA